MGGGTSSNMRSGHERPSSLRYAVVATIAVRALHWALPQSRELQGYASYIIPSPSAPVGFYKITAGQEPFFRIGGFVAAKLPDRS